MCRGGWWARSTHLGLAGGGGGGGGGKGLPWDGWGWASGLLCGCHLRCVEWMGQGSRRYSAGKCLRVGPLTLSRREAFSHRGLTGPPRAAPSQSSPSLPLVGVREGACLGGGVGGVCARARARTLAGVGVPGPGQPSARDQHAWMLT